MSSATRAMLVTCALPYANGALHLGHLLEQIQADIWVRFQRMQGHEVHFICADDAHGAPIMLKAQQQGITPEQLISIMQAQHQSDSNDFFIHFDNYHSTHSAENRQLVEDIYQRLQARGLITWRTIEQFYDPQQQQFLPDRFIQGGCPRCQAADQYGDNCECCGSTYAATELLNPHSTLSGATPVMKQSGHFFFNLPAVTDWLQCWTRSGTLPTAIMHKLQEWFESGLKPWDITRDAPYFGFEIPEAPGKYFYVWLDAPIGYMATFKHLCQQRTNLQFEHFWKADSTSELYHFIGKDIVYFHGLFWPALLVSAGFRTPSKLFVHGFITVNGAKMSKSKGTFIQARHYLQQLEPECLRYYYAAKTTAGIEDLDLNLEDFRQRVNSDIVNKLVNLASRCAGFIQNRFNGQLAATLADQVAYQPFIEAASLIAAAYETREFGKAMRHIMQLADSANHYIDQQAPWLLAKQSEQPEKTMQLQAVCSQGINSFRVLMTYLKPVMPSLAQRVEAFLNQELTWAGLQKPLLNHTIGPYKTLFRRIESSQIESLLVLSAAEQCAAAAVTTVTSGVGSDQQSPLPEPIAATISLEHFNQVDLRVARITQAEVVPSADKLLKLTLDLGGTTRQVFAGIKCAYHPEELLGRLTIVVANLAARKMRFGISEGMVLAAGAGNSGIFLLQPDSGAQPGMRVR